MAETYEVVTAVPGYYTSYDAMSGTDRRNTVKPATYYVFKEANGAINVTSIQGTPGSWINPADNVKSENPVTDNENPENPSETRPDDSSKSTYATSTTPAADNSTGTNKKVYSPAKDYIPCYIINELIPSSRIEFECEPEEISDNVSANYDTQEVRGRSSQYQGYNDSGPREINFTVTLHDDLCKDGILATVNRLKSLAYPGYSGILVAPHCLMRMGDMISCRAIITSVGVSWQKPFRDGVYVTATVDISGTEVVDTPYGASEIWAKGGNI